MQKFQNKNHEFVDGSSTSAENTKKKWLRQILISSFFNIWGNLIFLRILIVIARAGLFETITLLALSSIIWALSTCVFDELSEVTRESLKTQMQQCEDSTLIFAIFAVTSSITLNAATFFALSDSCNICYIKAIDGALAGFTFAFIGLICTFCFDGKPY